MTSVKTLTLSLNGVQQNVLPISHFKYLYSIAKNSIKIDDKIFDVTKTRILCASYYGRNDTAVQ